MDNQILYLVLAVTAVWIISSIVKNAVTRLLVKKALQAGASVIDVRTAAEYDSGHFNGAVNIPLDSLAGNKRLPDSREKTVIVYCASGARSRMAAGILTSAGYSRVINAGGIGNMPRQSSAG